MRISFCDCMWRIWSGRRGAADHTVYGPHVALHTDCKEITQDLLARFGPLVLDLLSIVMQAFANMARVHRLVPVTGQTLPYISMGGTSLLFTSLAFGMIVSVSKHINSLTLERSESAGLQDSSKIPIPMKIIISGGEDRRSCVSGYRHSGCIQTDRSATEILFVGAEGKNGNEYGSKAGYKIIGLPISSYNSLSMRNVSLFRLAVHCSKAWNIIGNFKPDAVIGDGGLCQRPVLKVAAWRKIPYLDHKQNSYAGSPIELLGNRASAPFCYVQREWNVFFPKDKIIWRKVIRYEMIFTSAIAGWCAPVLGIIRTKEPLAYLESGVARTQWAVSPCQ